MARLIPAECPKCGGAVKLDPGKEFVTCEYCQTSSFIQTNRRPPTEQVRTQHIPVITIQPMQIVGGLVRMIISVVMFFVILGAGIAFAIYSASSQITQVDADVAKDVLDKVSKAMEQAQGQAKLMGKSENLFAEPSKLREELHKSIGPFVKITEMTIYPEYAFLTVQNPKKETELDRYQYRNGLVGSPEPVLLSGAKKKELPKRVFGFDDVDFTVIPKIAKDALVALEVESGKVSHIMLDKALPFSKDVLWRVYASGPRGGGYVQYSLQGKRKKVMN
jgi:hypothetical protein